MDTESIQARIEHETAELRGLYPEVIHCHAVLLQWTEGTEPRFSLHLDIRRPQQQLVVNGEQRADAQTALAAGFGAARERLQGAAWATR
jgi:hypothetical protein